MKKNEMNLVLVLLASILLTSTQFAPNALAQTPAHWNRTLCGKMMGGELMVTKSTNLGDDIILMEFESRFPYVAGFHFFLRPDRPLFSEQMPGITRQITLLDRNTGELLLRHQADGLYPHPYLAPRAKADPLHGQFFIFQNRGLKVYRVFRRESYELENIVNLNRLGFPYFNDNYIKDAWFLPNGGGFVYEQTNDFVPNPNNRHKAGSIQYHYFDFYTRKTEELSVSYGTPYHQLMPVWNRDGSFRELAPSRILKDSSQGIVVGSTVKVMINVSIGKKPMFLDERTAVFQGMSRNKKGIILSSVFTDLNDISSIEVIRAPTN